MIKLTIILHVNYQQAIDKNLLLDFKICYHGLLSMISIALVDARKTSLTGPGSDIAASRLVDDAPHRRWLNPPPLEKS